MHQDLLRYVTMGESREVKLLIEMAGAEKRQGYRVNLHRKDDDYSISGR